MLKQSLVIIAWFSKGCSEDQYFIVGWRICLQVDVEVARRETGLDFSCANELLWRRVRAVEVRLGRSCCCGCVHVRVCLP